MRGRRLFVTAADAAGAELELRRRAGLRADAERHETWRAWLARCFPAATAAAMAPRHERLWEWFSALEPGRQPPPQIEIWPRGGAKSTSAELGTTFAGTRRLRRFCLYISGTQDLANLHVGSIAQAFEAAGHGRAVSRYGASKAWRVDMLRVDNGFNVMALGLDVAARGIKLENLRPDLIILDDIDGRHDSEKVVKKKVRTLTQTLLPTGSPDVAILGVQNLVHAGSIFAQLADGRADFLHNRVVHQEAAVEELEIAGEILADGRRHYRVTRGRATWAGQNLATVEYQLNTWGRIAFMREAQHYLGEAEGGMWDRERDIDPFRDSTATPADMELIAVAIDPNASEGGDAAGIVVGGRRTIAGVKHAYIFADETTAGGPLKWARKAVEAHQRWDSDRLVAEANNGGDMVEITIGTISKAPKVKLVHASRGKVTRAAPVQKLYEEGRVHHVGVFPALEGELCSWVPGEPSPNRLDADVWLVSDLLIGKDSQMPFFASAGTAKPPEPDEPQLGPARAGGRPLSLAQLRALRRAARQNKRAGTGA